MKILVIHVAGAYGYLIAYLCDSEQTALKLNEASNKEFEQHPHNIIDSDGDYGREILALREGLDILQFEKKHVEDEVGLPGWLAIHNISIHLDDPRTGNLAKKLINYRLRMKFGNLGHPQARCRLKRTKKLLTT